jgi:rhamnose transport system substrate-binding protein
MAQRLRVAVLPKCTSNPYFESCRQGVDEAAAELGVEVLWAGPAMNDAARQRDLASGLLTEGLAAIAASVESSELLSPVLREARGRGVHVVTWDADAEADARAFTVVPSTAEGLAQALAYETYRLAGGAGEFAVIASLTASNQSAWLAQLKACVGRDYPTLRLAGVAGTDESAPDVERAARSLLASFPGLRAIVGLGTPSVPGAAAVVKALGRRQVRVTGLSLPSQCRELMHEGVVGNIVLWNAVDLGYLTVHTTVALAQGRLQPGALTLRAGRLHTVLIQGDEVRLGRPAIITPANVDGFSF